MYNLVQSKNIKSEEVVNVIKYVNNVVREITVQDIYSDKNFSDEEHAVIYEVNYCSKE